MRSRYQTAVNEHEGEWEALARMLHTVQRSGLRALSHEELAAFVNLYRRAASDLNYFRTQGTDLLLVDYLNSLVAGAHNQIYRSRNLKAGDLLGLFTHEFPRMVRKHFGAVMLSTLIMVGTGVVGYLIQSFEPDFQRRVIPSGVEESLQRAAGPDSEPWFHEITVFGMQPVASSTIMANNISVTIAAFGLGILGGLGTIYILLFNGLLIGTIIALCEQYGQAGNLMAFLAPHGALELPAIFIAGGAGLVLGSALVTAGRHRRRDELRLRGLDAVKMAVGCAPILVVAGIVEGFISPIPNQPVLKPIIGLLLFIWLVVFLTWGGKERKPSTGSEKTGR